jgi:hypothetical protein
MVRVGGIGLSGTSLRPCISQHPRVRGREFCGVLDLGQESADRIPRAISEHNQQHNYIYTRYSPHP